MIPIVEAMISEIRSSRKQSVSATTYQATTITVIANETAANDDADNPRALAKVRQTLLLAVAYAANIGG